MTFAVHNLAGAQPIANTSTTQAHALGTIVRATDPTYGEGEFIYLLGVGSTVAGSLCTYNASTWATTLLANTASLGLPVVRAMSANVASQYGWYMESGVTTVTKGATTVAAGARLFVAASGACSSTAASGKEILGMICGASAASATTTITVTLMRPKAQGSAV